MHEFTKPLLKYIGTWKLGCPVALTTTEKKERKRIDVRSGGRNHHVNVVMSVKPASCSSLHLYKYANYLSQHQRRKRDTTCL